MKQKINWKRVILVSIFFTLAILLISQLFISWSTTKQCRRECLARGGFVSQMIPDVKWFSNQNYCQCWHKEGAGLFQLNIEDDE